eukprot:6185891-Pleurochrysis_carterae.AAC.1
MCVKLDACLTPSCVCVARIAWTLTMLKAGRRGGQGKRAFMRHDLEENGWRASSQAEAKSLRDQQLDRCVD